MTRKTFFSALIILFVFPGCSLIHKVFRNQEAPASQKQVIRKPILHQRFNTGGPPAKTVKRRHTYVYETVHSAGTQQFVITDMPVLVKPPERAVKVRIGIQASPTATHKPIMPMHKKMADKPGSRLRGGESKRNADKKEKPATQSVMKTPKIVRVLFDLDSCKISQDASRKLRSFVKYYIRLLKDMLESGVETQHSRLATHDLFVDVTGYTCWLGPKKYNQSLALKRAKAVALRLKKAGVTIRSVSGKGKCCYIDRKNPAPNRRAEVTVFSSSAGENVSRKGGGVTVTGMKRVGG